VAQWVDECTIVKPGVETSALFIYADYERWCVRNGRQSLNNVNFGKELRRLGVMSQRRKHGMVYGIGLLTPEGAAASAVNP
jgi:phage/plasmid-associated DNA primase